MRNKSVIIASALLIIMIIAIAGNAYYIHTVSTGLLDMVFALPSEYNYINNLDAQEIENLKSDINKIAAKWEKNARRICAVTRYSDFERVNSQISGLKEYFFAWNYSEYLAARKKLIAALEKQKLNEVPNLENIF